MAKHAGDVDNAAVTSGWAARALVCAPLLFWFAIAFPWWHHNDSLEWVPALKRVSFWNVLSANPIPSVLTYRPLGTAMAWLTFHCTGGQLWLQQLINVAFSCGAWLLAAHGCRRPRALAWIGMLCTGGYFAGYIYLFHLHGVFYGPLLLWLAWLCGRDGGAEASRSVMSLLWLTVCALAAGLCHTYALVFACAFLVGEWAEQPANESAQRRVIRFGAVALLLLAARLLTPADSHAQHLTVQQVLVAYRVLEVHPAVQVMSGLLALLCASGVARTAHARVVILAACLAAVLACMLLKVPPFLVWVGACLIARARQRRFGQAALIAVAAAFPAATGTGSPVYAVFVTLPCAVATAESAQLPALEHMPRRLALSILAALALVAIMLRVQFPLPVVSKLAKPLLAEKEKTTQLARVFEWLDTQPQLTGDLQLCTPASTPASSESGAVDRGLRAPTYGSFFRDYVRDRYADRLTQPDNGNGKSFRLCFGGQSIAGARLLLQVAGRWAGSSTLFEADSNLRDASASLQAE